MTNIITIEEEISKIYHGVRLADNSQLYNLEIEKFFTDPNPIRIGRIWYNLYEKHFKYTSLDKDNNIIIKTFLDFESIPDIIIESHNVNCPNTNLSNPYFNLPNTNTLDENLNLLVNEINKLYTLLINNKTIEYFYTTLQINTITLTKSIYTKINLIILINGLEQYEDSYNIVNNKTILFTESLPPNSVIKVVNTEILL